MKNNSAIELGDLAPLRDARGKIANWITDDKARRPGNDPVVHALEQVLNWIDTGLADAANPEMELTIKQQANTLGLSPAALYKRRQRAAAKADSETKGKQNKTNNKTKTDEQEKAA